MNLFTKLYTFASILPYIYMCGSGSVLGLRIWIHKSPEYGSITDPDPQLCLSQSSTSESPFRTTGKKNILLIGIFKSSSILDTSITGTL